MQRWRGGKNLDYETYLNTAGLLCMPETLRPVLQQG